MGLPFSVIAMLRGPERALAIRSARANAGHGDARSTSVAGFVRPLAIRKSGSPLLLAQQKEASWVSVEFTKGYPASTRDIYPLPCGSKIQQDPRVTAFEEMEADELPVLSSALCLA